MEWTKEKDLMLAEIVLRHLREGSDSISAFEEAGKLLNKTASSCGYRWNHVVRHHYHGVIELAKKQRKTLKLQKEESALDKGKLVKWLKEEIYGCESRGEQERENAMRELLAKVERGYFDKKEN